MSVTIEEYNGGLRIVRSPDIDKIIESEVIDGICEVTVTGRDMEDGLAPLQVISAIIDRYLGGKAEYEMPDPPDWLNVTDWDEATTQEEFNNDYGIDPMDMALANLIMFGGEKGTTQLEKKEQQS